MLSSLNDTGWSRAVLALAFAAAAGACGPAAPAPAPPPLPETSGTLAVAGLSAPVRVVRDRWGIAHIDARSEHDLFFAQGFVQAQDRLFQMDLWRRAASGQLSAVLGANFIERDVMTRRLQPPGLLDGGADDWEALGPGVHAIAEAFVEGVNAWVARVFATPPDEFRLAGWTPAFWKPEDLLARTDAFPEAKNALAEILRANVIGEAGVAGAAALMPLDPDSPTVVPSGIDPDDVSYLIGDALRRVGTPPFFTALASSLVAPAASNAWAVDGSRSETGRPLLAADPHAALSLPSLRYLVHLKAPGWNVIGATFPWAPGVAIGHNEHVAWGVAALDADVQDLYVERLNPDSALLVREGTGWSPISRRPRLLRVKGRVEPFEYNHDTTHRGVVVAVNSDRHLAFALRWSGLEAGAAPVLGAIAIDRAGSAAEFRRALAGWKTPARVFVFADAEGRIGMQAAGLVPVRRGWTGVLPVPGWDGAYAWGPWRALDELPHADRPPQGYLAAANERPASLDAAAGLGFEWGSPARAKRLQALLESRDRFSVEDFGAFQHDVTAWNAGELVPLLANLQSDDAAVERARQLLLAWDRRVADGSSAASIYVAWERALTRALIAPHLGRASAAAWIDIVGSPGAVLVPALVRPSRAWFGEAPAAGRDAMLQAALRSAVEDLRRAAGDDPDGWAWGALHAVEFEHPLAVGPAARTRYNLGPFKLGGYRHTVMASGGGTFTAEWGASFRQVIDVGDWDRSVVTNTPGQSEWPDSPHYADLVGSWAAGEYVPLPFTESAVRENAADALILEPVGP